MTSTGLARRGSNFIPVETEETSELSSPLMTDRVHGGEVPPRALAPASGLPCVTIFRQFIRSRTLIRFNNLPLVTGKELARCAIFPLHNGIFSF